MMKLYYGNPHDAERIEKEQATYALLDSLGIEYARVDHESAATIEACHTAEAVLGYPICKNLFLRNSNSSKYYLLLMPGEKQFKTKVLSAEIGSTRLSFAGDGEMLEYLNITPGSVSVMGLQFDCGNKVELLIDREVADGEYICCHPCINTSTLKIKTADVLAKFLPKVGHGYRIVEMKT